VSGPLRRLRILFGTRHGLTLFGRTCAVQFGVLAGAAQLFLTFWPEAPVPRWPVFLGIAGTAVLVALLLSLPRNTVGRDFTHPDFTVTVELGDLFDRTSHLVVGFTDTFDTDTGDEALVTRRSVQGQLLHRLYGGDVTALDAGLTEALAGVEPAGSETPAAKRLGKLVRYPVGTVAVVKDSGRLYFCTAYGRMNNNLVTRCDTEQLWNSLARLWEAIREHGHREAVAMPIVGSDLARINNMDHASLLKTILLSFVAHARAEGVCRSLTVVIHPQDHHRVDMLDLGVFLRSL
jgi:hypothetical protein